MGTLPLWLNLSRIFQQDLPRAPGRCGWLGLWLTLGEVWQELPEASIVEQGAGGQLSGCFLNSIGAECSGHRTQSLWSAEYVCKYV